MSTKASTAMKSAGGSKDGIRGGREPWRVLTTCIPICLAFAMPSCTDAPLTAPQADSFTSDVVALDVVALDFSTDSIYFVNGVAEFYDPERDAMMRMVVSFDSQDVPISLTMFENDIYRLTVDFLTWDNGELDMFGVYVESHSSVIGNAQGIIATTGELTCGEGHLNDGWNGGWNGGGGNGGGGNDGGWNGGWNGGGEPGLLSLNGGGDPDCRDERRALRNQLFRTGGTFAVAKIASLAAPGLIVPFGIATGSAFIIFAEVEDSIDRWIEWRMCKEGLTLN